METISSKISNLHKAYKQLNGYKKIKEVARELRFEISKRMSTRYDIIVEFPLFIVQKYNLNPITRPIKVIKEEGGESVFNIYLPPMHTHLPVEFLERYRAEMGKYIPWFVKNYPNLCTSPIGANDFDVLITVVLRELMKTNHYFLEYLRDENKILEEKGLRKRLLLTTGEAFIVFFISKIQEKIFNMELELMNLLLSIIKSDVSIRDVLAVIQKAGRENNSALIEDLITTEQKKYHEQRRQKLKRDVGAYAWLFTDQELTKCITEDDYSIIKRKINLCDIFSKLFSGPDFLDLDKKADKSLIRLIINMSLGAGIENGGDALKWLFENREIFEALSLPGSKMILHALKRIEERKIAETNKKQNRSGKVSVKTSSGSDKKKADKAKLRERMNKVWSEELQKKIENEGVDPLAAYACLEAFKMKGGAYPTGAVYRNFTNVMKAASGKYGDREKINVAMEFLISIGIVLVREDKNEKTANLTHYNIKEEWREIAFWVEKQ
ncbi:MAG: hypothetical protein QXG02_02110 [Candidatus Anstonellales archaeon]